MIDVKNITVCYGGSPAISDISFSLPMNSLISFIGPNGSGKSTLIKAMAGIVPFTGDISYKKIFLNSLSGQERARLIAYLPQARPIPSIDVNMLVEHGRFPHLDFMKRLTAKDRQKIDKAIELTNISHLLERRLSHISGGERQRVYLAMAIAQDADIFLLDEPMSYLDISFQTELYKIIDKLHKSGKTIIMATHDLPQAFSYSEYICAINQGKISGYGAPEEMCEDSCIKDIFGFEIEALNTNKNALYSYILVKEGQK